MRLHKTSRELLYRSLFRSVYSNGANMSVQAITKLNNPSAIWCFLFRQKTKTFSVERQILSLMRENMFYLNGTYRVKNRSF